MRCGILYQLTFVQFIRGIFGSKLDIQQYFMVTLTIRNQHHVTVTKPFHVNNR